MNSLMLIFQLNLAAKEELKNKEVNEKAEREFEDECFRFGIELDDVVSTWLSLPSVIFSDTSSTLLIMNVYFRQLRKQL